MPRFTTVCIVAREFQQTRNFYRQVLQAEPSGDEDYARFATEQIGLTIFAEEGMEQLAPGCMRSARNGGRAVLEFEVDDVDAEYDRLKRIECEIVKPPTTQPWGFRSVWIRDPEGNILNFYRDLNQPAGSDRDPKKLTRQYFQKLLNDKDLSVIDELLAPDYIDDDAPPGAPPGPEDTRRYIQRFLGEYPDLRITIEDLLAEGDKVAARLVWHGHHKGTGAKFHQEGIVILQFNDQGQIVRRWSAYQRN